MTLFTISIIMIVVMLALIFLRSPVALSMGLVGVGGYAAIRGWDPLLYHLQTVMVDKYVSYNLVMVPLFILMGQIAAHTGVSRDIFTAANAWIGHRRGGLAMASVAGCGVFGALCGSSIATATTMTKVALPEMRRHNYSDTLSAGSLAAGGTLGILVPPSIVLIIYAVYTEQNTTKLFLAATIPSLLAILGFILAIAVYVRLFPAEGPVGDRLPLKERIRALNGIWQVVLVFVVSLGGIYSGFLTIQDGAAFGVVLMAGIGLLTRTIGMRGLIECIRDSAVTSAMVFAIIFGADLFKSALALTQMPIQVVEWIGTLGWSPMSILIVLILFYLIMGCIMDSLSIILLTVPVFFPVFMSLDFGLAPTDQALWFGIITLIVVELGLITPPVGLNLFVISGMAPDIPDGKIFRGVVPFIIAEFGRIILIVSFPSLTFALVHWVDSGAIGKALSGLFAMFALVKGVF